MNNTAELDFTSKYILLKREIIEYISEKLDDDNRYHLFDYKRFIDGEDDLETIERMPMHNHYLICGIFKEAGKLWFKGFCTEYLGAVNIPERDLDLYTLCDVADRLKTKYGDS